MNAADRATGLFVEIEDQLGKLTTAVISRLYIRPADARHAPVVRLGEHDVEAQRSAKDRLTVQSIIACVLFAVGQPGDCFIRKFELESV